MNDYTNLKFYINTQIESISRDTINFDQKSPAIEAYRNVLSFIDQDVLAIEEYRVDYNCPARNAFISSAEANV